MEFGAIPAVVGGHDRLCACTQGGCVALSMDISQLSFTDHRIALIYTVLGAAIANKVFGCGNHMGRAKAVAAITLQAGDNFPSIGC